MWKCSVNAVLLNENCFTVLITVERKVVSKQVGKVVDHLLR